MIQYHHHPDGLIYVRGEQAGYMDTLENFARDYGHAAPALPVGMVECIYEPGGRHVYFDAKQNAHPLEHEANSAEHEAICVKLDDLLTAQSRRVAAEDAAASAANAGRPAANAPFTGTIQL